MNEPNTLQGFLMLHRQQHRRQKLYSGLAICWAVCGLACLGAIALGQAAGLDLRLAWPVIGTAGAALAALVFVKVLMVDWLTLDEIVRRHRDAGDYSDDAFFLINVDPGSPDYLRPVRLDVGHGRFPQDLDQTDRYFPNDPRSDSPALLFETAATFFFR